MSVDRSVARLEIAILSLVCSHLEDIEDTSPLATCRHWLSFTKDLEPKWTVSYLEL
jgi:hypothetical protein